MAEDDLRYTRWLRFIPQFDADRLMPVDPVKLYTQREERLDRSGPLFRRAFKDETVTPKERERNLQAIEAELRQWRAREAQPAQAEIDDRMSALSGILQSDLLIELLKVDRALGQTYAKRIRKLRADLGKLRASNRIKRVRSGKTLTNRDVQEQVVNNVRPQMEKIVEELQPIIERAMKVSVDKGVELAAKQYEMLYPDGPMSIDDEDPAEHLDGKRITVLKTDDYRGNIEAMWNNGDIMVRTSYLDIEQRGQGIGTEMYARLATYAAENDTKLRSDVIVSTKAARVWDALKKRGWPVVKNPKAELAGGSWFVKEGDEIDEDFEYVTRSGKRYESVYKIDVRDQYERFAKILEGEVETPTFATTREKQRVLGEIIRGDLVIGELPDLPRLNRLKRSLEYRGKGKPISRKRFLAIKDGGYAGMLDVGDVLKTYELTEPGIRDELESEDKWWVEVEVPIKKIRLPGWDEPTPLESLYAAIDQDAPPVDGDLLEPVLRNDGSLIANTDRLRAAIEAGQTHIPAVVPRNFAYDLATAERPTQDMKRVTLSSRLWRDHQARGVEMAQDIAKVIKAGGSNYDIADAIIGVDDTGAFATKPPNIALAGYIEEMYQAAKTADITGEKNELLRVVRSFDGVVEDLGSQKGLSFTLKSHVQEFQKQIVKAEGDQIDKVLRRYILDRARIHARMIARTEAVRAYRESYIESLRDKPWVDGIRWKLSHLHPKPDVCDLLANQDLHGLGPGGYPLDEVPPVPHPNDMCLLTGIFDFDYARKEIDRIKNEREDKALNRPDEHLDPEQHATLVNLVEHHGTLGNALHELKKMRFGHKVSEKAAEYKAKVLGYIEFAKMREEIEEALTLPIDDDRIPESFRGRENKRDQLIRLMREEYNRRLDFVVSDEMAEDGIIPNGYDFKIFTRDAAWQLLPDHAEGLTVQEAIDELKRWHPEPIPAYMDTVTVLHATDAKTAARFLREGIIPQMKPYTQTQLDYINGETGHLDPRFGLERGLYVAQYEDEYRPASEIADRGFQHETRFERSEVLRTMSGWNDVVLEIQVPKAWLERPAELEGKLDNDIGERLVRNALPYTNVRLANVDMKRVPVLRDYLHRELVDAFDDVARRTRVEEIVDAAITGTRRKGEAERVDFRKLFGEEVSENDRSVLKSLVMDSLNTSVRGLMIEGGERGFPKYREWRKQHVVSLEQEWNLLRRKRIKDLTTEDIERAFELTEELFGEVPIQYLSGEKLFSQAMARRLTAEGYGRQKRGTAQQQIEDSMFSSEWYEVNPTLYREFGFGHHALGYDRWMERPRDGEKTADKYVPEYPIYKYAGPMWEHYDPDEMADVMRQQQQENYAVWEQDYFGDYHLVFMQKGDRYSVNMKNDIRGFQRIHGNTTDMHNHPGGNTPSPPDIMSAMRLNPASMQVAASNGIRWELRRPEANEDGGWYTHPSIRAIQDEQPSGPVSRIDEKTYPLHKTLNEAWGRARRGLARDMAEYIETQDPGWAAKVYEIQQMALAEGYIDQTDIEDRSGGAFGNYARGLVRARDEFFPSWKNVPILPLNHPAYDRDVEREIFDARLAEETTPIYTDLEWFGYQGEGGSALIRHTDEPRVDRARRQRVRYDGYEPGYFDDRLRLPGNELSKESNEISSPLEKRYRQPWDGTYQTARAWLKNHIQTEEGDKYARAMLGPTRYNVFRVIADLSTEQWGSGVLYAELLGKVIDAKGRPVPVWEMIGSLEQNAKGKELLSALREGATEYDARKEYESLAHGYMARHGWKLMPNAHYRTSIKRTPRENLKAFSEEERFTEDDR